MSESIKVREVEDFFDDPPFCPFCGTQALEFGAEPADYEVKPCPHLLFFCYDDGWDYLADPAKQNLEKKGITVTTNDGIEVFGESADDLDCGDSPDAITNEISIPGAVKLAFYFGAPNFYGSYIGFAPTDERP